MSKLPSIILISPPSRKSGEVAILTKLFEAGLARFHLRKPNWSVQELSQYLSKVPTEHISKIVIHRFPELLNDFALAGYHHTSTESIRQTKGSKSRSLHKLSELINLQDPLDYAFFGPVYHSISKKGYTPKISLNEIFAFFNSGKLKQLPKVPNIYALGGIRKKKIKKLSEIGFNGVALLGSVWGSRDPLRAMNEFLKLDVEFLLSSRDQASNDPILVS